MPSKRSRYASLAVNYDLSPCLFLITNKSEEIELLTGLFCCQLREQADCQKSMIRLRTCEKFCLKAKGNSPTNLQHSLLIRLLRFEITFNADVFFFFLLAVHANNSFSLSQRDVCAAGCCYGLLNYGLFFLFSLQGIINMRLYDNQLYANLEDLTI